MEIRSTVLPNIHSVVLKLASQCNLNCSYCYVYNHEDQGHKTRPKFISDETYSALLGRMLEYSRARDTGHSWTLSYHGGEPTLVGIDRFRRLVRTARDVLGENLSAISLQTNATLLNERWAEALAEDKVIVSVSIDGEPAAHDLFRVDHFGRGSYSETVRGIKALQATGLDLGILCVMNPWKSGKDAYDSIRSLGVTRMDFLLPDVSHDNKLRIYGALPPRPVSRYMLSVFDAWMAEDDPNVSVRFFRDLIQRILGVRGVTDSFSGGRSGYVIVETDGEIEANDALRVCSDGISRSTVNVNHHGFDDLALGNPFVYRAVTEEIRIASGLPTLSGTRLVRRRILTAPVLDRARVRQSIRVVRNLLEIFAHVRRRLAQHTAAVSAAA